MIKLNTFAGLLLVSFLFACGNDTTNNDNNRQTNQNSNNKSTNNSNNTQTTNTTTQTTAPLIIKKSGFVPIDLGEFVKSDSKEKAKAYEVDNASQLLEGPVALGKLGDYIIENEHVKFLIEGDTRNMNPCPWGGNILDAAVKSGEAPNLDILGEVCLLLNASFTLKPEQFEILQVENTSVLAVAGKLTLGDFINIKSMITDIIPALANAIKTDTETIPEVDVTIYYILRPEDRGLRVITAIENKGKKKIDLSPIHLVASGGDGYYFNPISKKKGFGIPAGLSTSATPFPFIIFNGDKASYGYIPEPVERLKAGRDLPTGGAYLIFAGVAASMLRETNVLNTLLSPAQLEESEGALHLDVGDKDSFSTWFFAGDGSLSSILDHGYEKIGVATTMVKGKVLDSKGNPFEAARVTAIYDGATYNQTKSNKDGSFEMRLPSNREYRIYARFENRPAKNIEVFKLKDQKMDIPTLELRPATSVVVNITDDSGTPTPGRVSILCVDGCKDFQTVNDADVKFHTLPSQYGAIQWAGVDGKIEIELPAGKYRIVVSRGLEWSTWPSDATESTGAYFELKTGGHETFNAEIMKVLDTPNAISADFHIHTIASPDSTVEHQDRVLGFMGAGVDVMVSTDHDIITDFAPAIKTLKASQYITSMIGEEATTSDLGHFNAFPLVKDDTKTRRGGAVDWGGGESFSLDPKQLFERLNAFPGEQVIQMNHPDRLGMIRNTQSDVLRGISLAERKRKRIAPKAVGPNGDTGLWDEGFSAMEIMNGNSQKAFWTVAHWWFTMIGRGFVPTGTATSDTHKKYSNLGGVPRTYVFIDGMSDAQSFNESTFVKGVNQGQAFGTNGPFFRVSATNQKGISGGPGSTISTNDKTINVKVEIQVPEWIDITKVDYYFNPDPTKVFVKGGSSNDKVIPPSGTIPISFSASDITTLQGTTTTHKLKRKTVNFDINSAVDGFLVVIVSGKKNMFPVVLTTPFAFSNPIFIDADGNGYDHPPYFAASQTPIPKLNRPIVQKDLPPKEMSVHEMNHAIGTILHELVCTH